MLALLEGCKSKIYSVQKHGKTKDNQLISSKHFLLDFEYLEALELTKAFKCRATSSCTV